jgi:type III pantothenate kinase
MLLAIDIGNTHTVLGLYDGKTLRHHWRLHTELQCTADEYGVFVRRLLASVANPRIDGVALSSVVPPVTAVFDTLCRRALGIAPLLAAPGLCTGMPILYDDPHQLGTDRIMNAIAAYDRTHAATIVVDLGTATKLEYVSGQGEYVGGIIAPGLGIAADALFAHAAKLYRVELAAPPQVVGRNMVHAIQSGLVYGYASLVDGLVARMQREINADTHVIATGGFAGLVAPESERIEAVEEFLTLDGLRLIYERNSDQ